VQKAIYSQRRQNLVREFRAKGVDCLLVSALPNIRYLAGFTGSNALLLLWEGGAVLFTDRRYEIQAGEECDCAVQVARGPLIPEALKLVRRRKLRRVGFESHRVLFDSYTELCDGLRPGSRAVAVRGWVEGYRMVKAPEEIAAIRASVELNSRALERALKRLKPEMSEADLAAEIDYQMRRLGAEGTAFDTIVASGARAALPHAQPTSARIEAAQVLLIDMGAKLGGYLSDMTRTLFVGGAGKRLLHYYAAVREAQMAGVEAVREGIAAEKVDAACRITLARWRLDRFFVHSTGHGLGLEIHEAPRLGKKVKTQLKAGMVITIEPGVYIEDFCGIRIEDTVLVTKNGCEVLTPTSKEPVVV